MQTINSLQTRLTAAQQQIYGALRQGKLDRTEADALTAQLTQLQKSLDVDAFDGNGLTHGEVFSWAMDFVNQALQAKVGDANQDFGKRLQLVDARIDASLRQGSLTAPEAQALKAQVAQARRVLANARAGGLTPEEQAQLVATCDGLDARLSREVTDDSFDFPKRIQSMRAQIAAGLKAGTLTDAEGRQMTARVNQFEQLVQAAKRDGRIDPFERDRLGDEVANIAKAMNDRNLNTLLDPKDRAVALNDLITDNLRKGNLAPGKAAELRRELQGINATFGATFEPDAAGSYALRLRAFEAKVRGELFWT